ncbi:polyribonucleotide nucleotidyltransferase [Candidatus Uhrbacteria bacterium]|nr:polyribonucleotide nucleotidyltransferase [Candidatus Uhrbacteria bacterium]
MQTQRFEIEWGGRPLVIETGKFALAASGACTVKYGETIVLATAVMSEKPREGMDFFPLTVDFEEKLYAAGRIKGSRFIKKEGRPTDEAILVGRYIDRAVRPLFDDRLRHEIQVIVTVLSFDGENDPDVIGLIAASCALHMSNIPWNGPLANIRVGKVGDEWVINPTYAAREKSVLDLAFAGTEDKVLMVEAGAKEVSEDVVLDAFAFGTKHLRKVLGLLEEVRAKVGKEKTNPLALLSEEEQKREARKSEVAALAKPIICSDIQKYFFAEPQASKSDRRVAKEQIKKNVALALTEAGVAAEEIGYGTSMIGEILESEVSRLIIEEGRRVDGRELDDIRPLASEVALFERTHGSGHFMRGETQVLSVVTLGAPGDEQTLDGMETVGTKRYMHHYNFPPYSVGEVKPLRGPGRREIGHGALAEKALMPVLPEKEAFPYTIRVVSEVLTSNGSSSMGSTCGSSLALMDAGVPISSHVAGIAMGLATLPDGRWKVITDLQDLEDGDGGMDFKIAGTQQGITAIQMDTKTDGLTAEIVKETVTRAKSARLRVLDVMEKAIPSPRPDLSPYAPRIISLRINPELIGLVIGPGGKTINEIIKVTGVQAIDIEDDGLVMITSMNADAAQKAHEWVQNLTREIVRGEQFQGKVTRIMDFGAIVEFLPGKDGMVHVSELAPWRVEKVGDIVKLGDEVTVKVLDVDKDAGRISLSMKQAEGNDYSKFPRPAPRSEGERRPSARHDAGRSSRPPRP